MNDPLQTLYQLMSGRQPIAVKECADKTWGDWRPHLAMILSNPTKDSSNKDTSNSMDVDRRSIVTLGDTLSEKGFLYAAHFCYLMANLEFGSYENNSTKLILIGAEKRGKFEFDSFATNEAIQTTEIFEYVRKLSDPDSQLSSLAYFKYVYAIRLLDAGRSASALYYLETIARGITRHPELVVGDRGMSGTELATRVLELADRLKYLDPVYTTREGEIREMPDPEWLDALRSVLGQGVAYQEQQQQYEQQQEYYDQQNYYGEGDQQQQQQQEYYDQGQGQGHDPGYGEQPLMMKPIPEEPQEEVVPQQQDAGLPPMMNPSEGLTPPTFMQPSGVPPLQPPEVESSSAASSAQQSPVRQPPSMDFQQPPLQQQEEQQNYFSGIKTSAAPQPPPGASAFKPGPPKTGGSALQPPPPSKIGGGAKKPAESGGDKSKKPEEPKKEEGPGILGRFLGRFIKPPNQMHLPDEGSASIYYDEKLKRWVDKNADPADEAAAAANAAPPSDLDLSRNNSSADMASSAATTPMGMPPGGPPGMMNPGGMGAAPPPPGGNKFAGGLAKRRGLAGRIDVFKNSSSAPALAPGDLPPMPGPPPGDAPPSGPPPSNLFVPGPAPPVDDNNSAMMNNNTMPEVNDNGGAPPPSDPNAPPMFFNPNQVAATGGSGGGAKRNNRYAN